MHNASILPETNVAVGPYDDAFFAAAEQGMLRSAAAAVPHIIDFIEPRSVVDVGCGRGAWLSIFQAHGVERLLGLDGPYVDQRKLFIPSDCFSVADLAKPFTIPGRFDLAICLEVGEHLPPHSAASLIGSITDAAPVVLFSAAVPGQGGTHHINEQWPGYWQSLFARRGYACLDAIRPRIWDDCRVEWWYRQNLFIFVAEAELGRWPHLSAAAAPAGDLQFVHADILAEFQSIRGLLRQLAGAIRRRVRRG